MNPILGFQLILYTGVNVKLVVYRTELLVLLKMILNNMSSKMENSSFPNKKWKMKGTLTALMNVLRYLHLQINPIKVLAIKLI